MASITLKDIPRALHREVKAQAKRNRRSLNKEAISLLQQGLAQPPPVDVEQMLTRARQFRASLKFIATDEEINRFKQEGRP